MVARKIHISATTGKAFQVNTLPPETVAKLRQLMGRLQVAAREYDGSNYYRTKFLGVASGIAAIGGNSADMINAFASQALPGNNAAFSLDEVYLQARARLRGDKQSPSAFGQIIKTFDRHDSSVTQLHRHPHTGQIPLGNSAYQPRLAAVIDMLCDQGQGIDYLSLMTGPYKLSSELRDSYVVLTTADRALQIAICDDETMPTYVGREFVMHDISKTPGVKSVKTHDLDSYCEQMRKAMKLLAAAAPDLHLMHGTHLDDSDHAQSHDPELRVVRSHVAAKDVVFAPVAQDSMSQMFSTWAQMPRAAIPEQTSGWEDDPALDTALSHLQDTRRFIKVSGEDPQGSDILKPWILARIAEYKATRKGQVPDAQSGPIDDYPGLEWAMVDEAIYAHGRRFKMHLPEYADKYAPTPVVRTKAPSDNTGSSVKTPFKQAATKDTTERQKTIIADVLSYAARHQQFPSNGRLSDTTEDKRLWSKHEQWLRNNLDMGLGDFIREWTREQNGHYQKSHGGANAHALAGDIDGYPGYDWKLLDTCFRNYKRGFTTSLTHVLQGTKPERKSSNRRDAFTSQNFQSIQDLPVERRMSAPYKFVTTETHPENRNQLIQRVLDFACRKGKFPSANDDTEKYNIRTYWRAQEEWCLEREKLSLSRFILRWTREKAAEHRKDHDGQQPSSGPIKGFEDYSWDMLRTCFAKQQLSPKLEDVVACDPDGYRLDGSGPAVAVAPSAPRDRRQRGWQRLEL